MAGKRTAGKYHPYPCQEIVRLEDIHDKKTLKSCLGDMERALGRRLTDSQLATISSRCAEIRTWSKMAPLKGYAGESRPTMQDILRELKAISTANNDVARCLYEEADPETRCYIDAKLLFIEQLLPHSQGIVSLNKAKFRLAASEALSSFKTKAPARSGGRHKVYGQIELARFAAVSWAAMGGCSRNAKGRAQWAGALFVLAEINCPADNRELDRLLSGRTRIRIR